MLVGAEGRLAGSVGGGLVEAQAVREAQAALADGKQRLFASDMSGSALTGADLICGGEVRIMAERLTPDRSALFQTIADRMRQGLDSFLLTPIGESGERLPRALAAEQLPAVGVAAGSFDSGLAVLIAQEDGDYLLKAVPACSKLIVAGGGHVSLALVKIAAAVGFETTVIDDRPEFVSQERFPWLPPERRLVLPEFENCFLETTFGFPITRKCSIAILTRGHAFDSVALAQALSTPAGYIGMIGSRRKREAIYQKLQDKGVSPAALNKVYSPIGLAIGAETPSEIAVSIAAELIAVRAGLAPPRKQPAARQEQL